MTVQGGGGMTSVSRRVALGSAGTFATSLLLNRTGTESSAKALQLAVNCDLVDAEGELWRLGSEVPVK